MKCSDRLPKAVLFDMDGTILDSSPMWYDLPYIVLDELHCIPEPTIQEDLFPLGVRETAAFFKERYHPQQTEEEILEMISVHLRQYYHKQAQLKAGVLALMKCFQSHGIRMAVCTASAHIFSDRAMEITGASQYLKAVWTCEDVNNQPKTEPDLFLYAAGQCNAQPSEVWIFEDALHSIRAAKRAGFPVCAVADIASAFQKEEIEKLADCFLDTFAQWETVLPFAAFMKSN